MAKFMNIVRCKVKPSYREEYLQKIEERPKFDGQISAKYVETKQNEFFMIGEWNSEDDIAKARPTMIEFLDSAKAHFRRAVFRFRSNRSSLWNSCD